MGKRRIVFLTVSSLPLMLTTETIWIGIGFLGQGLFFGRWVVQWILSEKRARSEVPISFWYMSLFGGLITLAYALYREDPVFIAGQGLGSVVYVRNLMLIHRANRRAGEAQRSADDSSHQP